MPSGMRGNPPSQERGSSSKRIGIWRRRTTETCSSITLTGATGFNPREFMSVTGGTILGADNLGNNAEWVLTDL